jgi:biotin carboxylase
VGISPVRHAVAATPAEAEAVARTIGYPVVLKPRALGGSIGVVRVDDPGELPEAFRIVDEARTADAVSTYRGVLIEEFLPGPEYSVDSVTLGGDTHTSVVAEKLVILPPGFEEGGHLVPAASAPGLEEALDLVRAVHRVLGLDQLVTHTEFRLTDRGPRLIEVNARLGGDLIPYLGRLALGVDLPAAAADVALGREPRLSEDRSGHAAVVMAYPPFDLVVGDVRLRAERGVYGGLDTFEVVAAPGAELRLPPRGFLSRAAFAVVTAESRDECRARMAEIRDAIVVAGEPLVRT